jgi:hypothetical protein
MYHNKATRMAVLFLFQGLINVRLRSAYEFNFALHEYLKEKSTLYIIGITLKQCD